MQAMPAYAVKCDCEAPARFKIAAEWSDGTTRELKTYFLSCESCLRGHFLKAGPKQRACRLTPGETLSPPCIFELKDASPVRRHDLEV